MKRMLFISLMLLLATSFLLALPVNSETATKVAKNFVLERLGTDYVVSTQKMLDSKTGESYIYVFNLMPKGFILIAADDASIPVLGYSSSNNWGETEIPVQLQSLLESWNAQLQDIKTRQLTASWETQSLWLKYNRDPFSFVPERDYRDVSPLLTTVWGQGTYYNYYCPSGCPVGCVATAMAQIMRFWSFPAVGNGSHSYNCPPYGTLSADFGSTAYNWAAMPNNVTSTNTAVATICYHAGVAVNMQYNPNGSGAYSQDVPNALTTYFKYASSTQYREKSSYSSSTWEAMMKGELDNRRPIYYSGSSSQSGGHAFVLDGYQGSNFHINWGWNGSYNGYYALTALNPGGENFTNSQAAVIGIAPTSSFPTLSEGFEGTTFPPSGWSVTASTFARSTSNAISGSYSARYNVTATGTAASGKQLRTPALTIDDTCPNLTFKARAGTILRGEQFKVGYSTSATGPWTYFGTNAVLSTSAQSFSYTVNTLPAGSYYFVFETYSTNATSNSKTWIIDDIAGPYYPIPTQASINMTTWSAGTLAPGDESRSGNIFTLANVGTGTLTVTSVTNLSGTDFSTNFNSNISLVYGQTHDFGFTYAPLDYGSDNVNFQIVTNGGTITIALNGSAQYAVFSDGFENYTDFALTFSPWTQYDGDGSATYSVTGVTFPNQGYTGSYIIFNPSGCTPSQAGTALDPHLGSKGAYCLAATTPPNNDWLISPELTLNTNATLSFWAKSYTSSYGLERFKVLYSTTTNTYSAFTNYLAGSATTYIEAPTTWTQYSYTLPQAAKYFAVQCVSNDAFIFMVDDFAVSDNSTPPAPTFGNLSGYVYKYGTTQPIVNALVTVGTKQSYTDDFGFYQINNILTGTVSANVSAPGTFYHPTSQSGIVITAGNTTTQNFGLTWGELTANPTSVSVSLYQGETGSSEVVLSNPGGTANTLYAGYFVPVTRGASHSPSFVSDQRKPSPDKYGTPIPKITDAVPPDRYANWFSYCTINDANYYSAATTERGNYFLVSDFALMDGAITISQLRHYFYSPSGAQWGTNYNKFKWKIYSVSPTGSVTLLHTSDTITLTDPGANYYLLSTYTLPTAVTIPAGYDFIVTVAPTTTTGTGAGRPQSLATDAYTDNGLTYNSTNGWVFNGMDFIMDAYVNGTEWLSSYNFSGGIVPGGSVTLPLNFNTVGVSEGTKNCYMYIFNDANYIAPNPADRGDMMAVPISLTVSVATQPVAVLTGSNWVTNANSGSSSSSGDVFTLKNVGPGNLTITSINGLSGTPFTSNINPAISLAQNQSHSFGFTFNPPARGIYSTTVEIVTNGGTKTITLKGYADYVAEGFEGTFAPDGWMIVDNDGDSYNWYQYTVSGSTVAHTGTYCAASASYINDKKGISDFRNGNSTRGALTPDNWLITPRLSIVSGDELNYWIGAQDPNWPAEHYSVKISTTNNELSSFTTTLFSETLADGDWHNRILDLSAYAGQNIYIAFQHHNCTDQFILKLDDVLMPPLAAPLVYGNITGRVRKAGSDENIEGAVVSIAGRTFTTLADGNYHFENIVCDTYQLTATATGYKNYAAAVTIPENTTLTHNIFMDYAQLYAPVTTYNLSVVTGSSTSASLTLQNTGTAAIDWTADSGIWGGDMFPDGPLNEDFEDLDITGWTGSVAYYSDIYTGYGYNSNHTWVFAADGASSPQYIITPQLRVDSSSNLGFWYKQFNNSSESFSVKVSTTDNNIASFTQTLASIGPLTDTNWYQFSQSLAAYAGQDIYICFYYPRADGYQYGYIMLDDITGPTAILPPMEWLSTNPVSGTLAAGASMPVSLLVNATDIPVGSYTAQTWFFGDALNTPYKVYVNLTVTAPVTLTAPQNPVIESYPGIIALAWDPVPNANTYNLYGCDTVDGTYILLQRLEDNSIELSDAELTSHGLSNRAFFKITADTAILSTRVSSVQSKTSSPLQQNYSPNSKTKKLNVLQ